MDKLTRKENIFENYDALVNADEPSPSPFHNWKGNLKLQGTPLEPRLRGLALRTPAGNCYKIPQSGLN